MLSTYTNLYVWSCLPCPLYRDKHKSSNALYIEYLKWIVLQYALLIIKGQELIAPAVGNLIDFFEDIALSILYARKGKRGLLELSNFPLEINPLRDVNLDRVLFYNDSLKLLFGTFDPIKTIFLSRTGDILKIKSPENRVIVYIGAEEYARGIEDDLVRGVSAVEEILKTFTPLRVLYPRIQWIKVIMKYASEMG